MYNCQNDQVWAANRGEADKNDGVKQKQKFPQKVMVWLGAFSEGVTSLVILDNGTVNYQRYIDEVLPVALKYGNNVFGDDWTFRKTVPSLTLKNFLKNGAMIIFLDLLAKIIGRRILLI
ncbi:unnamed protein product [Rotaria socialis]|uniref:Uncharacterized protein n=1 Tax=Rotaria socialis TaxID=392032 RepID=A0A818FJB4_9BILA|nr:unnamed protein product [Rotaria socialis]